MKKIKFNFFACLVILTVLQAEIAKTTLEDYAYDFSNIGYEISFSASSSYFIPMTADDYFNATDGGYTLKVYIDGLSRKSRKDFVPYYNKECELSFDGSECQLFIEGEIELDETMTMNLKASKVNFLSQDRSKIIKSFK